MLKEKINYIYMLIEREFINSKKNIYKIGKTKQEPHKRFYGYPKDTRIIYLREVTDCDKCETDILNLFKNKFKLKKEIGREYFEGNKNDMVNEIHNYLQTK